MDLYTRNIMLSSEKLEEEKSYWLKKLEGNIVMSSFLTDFGAARDLHVERNRLNRLIKREVCERILSVSGGSSLGCFVMLLAGVTYMLSLYTYNDDIIIGMPSLKHESPGASCGLSALKTCISSGNTYRELLYEVKNTVTEAIKNGNITFGDIADQLSITGNRDNNDFFKTIVLFRGLHDEKALEGTTAQIVFYFSLQQSEIRLDVEYNRCLYSRETIEGISEHLEMFYEYALRNPELKLVDLAFPFRTLAGDMASKPSEYPKDCLIHRLFEKQAEEVPERVAVVSSGQSMTYLELNKKANQIAHELKRLGVGPDSIVGIMLERTADVVVSILGILKAGGAYMPIDSGYPMERIEYMLEDSGASVLLTSEKLAESIGPKEGVLLVDRLELKDKDSSNLGETANPGSLAYVIYTSGTTGKPKGVMIEHRNVVNLVYGIRDRVYGCYNRPLKVALVAPFVFDASIKQIFPSIMLGHTLFIVPEHVRIGGLELARYYRENKIDISDGTPVHVELLSGLGTHSCELSPVKHFMIGGESLSWRVVERFKSIWKECGMTNVYGPTECCDVAATYDIGDEETAMHGRFTVPIGMPLANTGVYVLDKSMKPLPINAVGELYISGDGVGRGYVNKSQLTAEKFLPDPFISGRRMYRTGDLARRLPDGNIEFIGRNDTQIKIRGFRIETAEIEYALLGYAEIDSAVVTAREDTNGQKHLCAYYTTTGERISTQTLRKFLTGSLPGYMLPSYYIQLEKLPLTHNGKVNFGALPDPFAHAMDEKVEYERPGDGTEAEIQDIWQSVLGKENIGVNDNFFDVGGNSVLLVQVHSAITEKYSGVIMLVDLFIYPTIRQLAALINERKNCKPTRYELNRVNLSDAYLHLNASRGPRSVLNFKIEGLMFQNLKVYANRIGADVKSTLAAVYVYLLAEISEGEGVVLQTMANYEDVVIPLEVKYEGMKRFSDLLRHIDAFLGRVKVEDGCRVNELGRTWGMEKEKGVVPLFFTRELATSRISLHDLFDIMLEVDLLDCGAILKCDYDTGIFKQEKVKQFLDKYLKLLKYIVETGEG